MPGVDVRVKIVIPGKKGGMSQRAKTAKMCHFLRRLGAERPVLGRHHRL